MRIFTQYPETAPFPSVGDAFQCCECGAVKMYGAGIGGTGFARTDGRQMVCYQCCAVRDSAYMQQHGRITLYLNERSSNGAFVGNWPGTLRFPVYGIRRSFHNFAGRNGRTDFYFQAFGREWHGYNVGRDSQIAHCRALKSSKH